jgi:DNA-binding MarR family transcriptional regulator
LIRRAQQIAVAIFMDESGEFDVTPIQFALLSELMQHEEIDQVTLASRIAVDVATLGQVAKRLEARGLIERAGDAVDRRRKSLVVTSAGRRLVKALVPRVTKSQERIMQPLTRAEQIQFLKLLGKLVGGNNDASRAPQSHNK